jgi:hypothetical protein
MRMLLMMFCFAAGCGAGRTPAPDAQGTAGIDSEQVASGARTAETKEVAEPPRRRSEPLPRAPLPEGIQRFDKDVITLALSGDGKFLVGGDLAGQALLWDLKARHYLWADPTPENGRIGRVAMSEVGGVYVAGAFEEPDRPMRAWAADKPERRGVYGAERAIAIDVAINADGRFAALLSSTKEGDKQRVSLWEVGKDTPLFDMDVPQARVGAVAIDAEGGLVAVADDLGGVSLYGRDGTRQDLNARTPEAMTGRFSRLAFGPLAKGDAGPKGQLWAARGNQVTAFPIGGGDGKAEAPIADSAPVRGLHRMSDGRIVAVTRPESGGLALFSTDGVRIGVLDAGCRCETHALASGGTMAACGCTPSSEVRYGAPRWTDKEAPR